MARADANGVVSRTTPPCPGRPAPARTYVSSGRTVHVHGANNRPSPSFRFSTGARWITRQRRNHRQARRWPRRDTTPTRVWPGLNYSKRDDGPRPEKVAGLHQHSHAPAPNKSAVWRVVDIAEEAVTEILTAHPIRTAGPLGTRADFEMALEYAKQGAVVSDTGLSGAVKDALDKVRDAAPNPLKRLIDAVMNAYIRSAIPRPWPS
jgi:hypothetical protein